MDAAVRYDRTPSGAGSAWWFGHAAIPALVLLGVLGLLLAGGDGALADALYDRVAARWALDRALPLSRLFYQGERALVMAAVLAGLGVLLAGLRHDGARRWRRPLSYLLLCFAATTALVSLGKHTTNVDCPRALAQYGGRYHAVGLLDDRPDDWPRAQCFPGGHSSAGFSFVSLYFLLGAGPARRRWIGLASGLTLGLAFAATQWARGMHFPSHDACSAAIAWAVALVTYTALYRRRL